MGMRLDVTAGGGKVSSSRVSAKWCTLLYLFLIFIFISVLDALRAEWSLRERKSLMSTGFGIKKYMRFQR